MEKLQIYQEYRFKKGETDFHIAEGDRIEVKTIDSIYQGYLFGVDYLFEDFVIDTIDGIETIKCEDVIEITPVLE